MEAGWLVFMEPEVALDSLLAQLDAALEEVSDERFAEAVSAIRAGIAWCSLGLPA